MACLFDNHEIKHTIFCSFFSLYFQQDQQPATVEILKPNDSIFVNGTEVDKSQPVKVSKIEILENKVINANQFALEKKPETEQTPTNPTTVQTIETPAATATPTKLTSTPVKVMEKKRPTKEELETSIVTADYIQQSMSKSKMMKQCTIKFNQSHFVHLSFF